MNLENLTINRVILHEVFRRRDDRNPIPARYGGQLINLPMMAADAFRSRIIDALGTASQSMEMTIREFGPNSAVEIASRLVTADDVMFVTQSEAYADNLVNAQQSRSLPGGIVIVFDGTVGAVPKRCVGVLKAETHSGFRRRVNNGLIDVSFFDDLFLSPQTRLYKIGLFVEDNQDPSLQIHDKWRVIVYDNNMTITNRNSAAKYFYDLYLGCSIPENAAILTKQFFLETRDFIRNGRLSSEEKSDIITGLYTYLKVDQSPTIDVGSFSNSYIPLELRDGYMAHMRAKRFPTNAVQKDITDVQGLLRQRKVQFSQSIRLTAPPEAFEEMISLETFANDADENGHREEWTRILVRDRIRDQE